MTMTDKPFAADDAPRGAKPERREPRYDLGKLVEGMTPESAHPEVDWGEPQGEEGW